MTSILLLVIIYVSFISLGLPDSMLGSAWPSMYGSLGVPLHYAGILAMIASGGTVVSSLFSARLIRRFGTGAVTAVSVLMTAAALLGFSLTHSFIALCFLTIPLGLGGGSVDAALNNYIALHYKARHMSWLHCFWGVGASTGPLIMGTFLTSGAPWSSGYRTIGLIQAALVAVLFISLPLWAAAGHSASASVRDEAPSKSTFATKELLGIAGVKQVLVILFCYCTIESTVGLWGSSFLVIVKNIAPEVAAKWIALYYIGITAGRFLSGFLTMALTSRQMIRAGQALIALGVVALALPLGTRSLMPAFFTIGLGCAPIYPAFLHETPRNFGEKYSQAIMGIQMASAYIGTTLMPPLFGRLAAYTSFMLFPIFVGAILLIKVLMTTVMNKTVGRH
jgi:fucose permease